MSTTNQRPVEASIVSDFANRLHPLGIMVLAMMVGVSAAAWAEDKAFARAVKREDITHGAELLGIPLEEHVGNCLAAMQARAEELGL